MKSQSRHLQQEIVSWTLACCMAALSLATEPTSSQAAPPTDARRQLLDLEKEWVVAEDKHDAAVLRRILDERFVATFGCQDLRQRSLHQAVRRRRRSFSEKGNLPTTHELACGTVCRDLDDLSPDSIAIGYPCAHGIAVAGVGISRIGIGLHHGPVGMEVPTMAGEPFPPVEA